MTVRCPAVLVAISAALAAGCGRGAGTPSGPSIAPPDIAGRYAGSVVYTAASPAEHCFSAWLRSQGGSHAFAVEVDLQQAGSQVTGVLRGRDISMTCELAGTVSGTSLSWHNTGCSEACTTFVSEPSCARLKVCTVDQTFAGAATAGVLEGAHTVTWDAFDAATEASAGRVVIKGTLRASR
jgi:hypothetical protein